MSILLPPANEACKGHVFTSVCLSTGESLSRRGGLCPVGWTLFSGVGSVQGVVSVQEGGGGPCPGGLCPGGICPRGLCTRGGGGSLSWWSLSGGSLSGGLCPGGSLSVWGGLCLRGRHSLSGRPPYGYVQVVCILPGCILVSLIFFALSKRTLKTLQTKYANHPHRHFKI